MKKENKTKLDSLRRLLQKKENELENLNIHIQVRDGIIKRFSVEEVWDGADFKF